MFWSGVAGVYDVFADGGFDKVVAARRSSMTEEQKAAAAERDNEAGLVVASGTLGGESIVGVIIAFVAVFASLAG